MNEEKNEQQDVQTKEEDNVDIEEDEDLKKDDIEETSNEDVDDENSQNSDKDDYDGILIATKDKDGNKIIKSSKKSKEEIV